MFRPTKVLRLHFSALFRPAKGSGAAGNHVSAFSLWPLRKLNYTKSRSEGRMKNSAKHRQIIRTVWSYLAGRTIEEMVLNSLPVTASGGSKRRKSRIRTELKSMQIVEEWQPHRGHLVKLCSVRTRSRGQKISETTMVRAPSGSGKYGSAKGIRKRGTRHLFMSFFHGQSIVQILFHEPQFRALVTGSWEQRTAAVSRSYSHVLCWKEFWC
jgi:hypothetical protein